MTEALSPAQAVAYVRELSADVRAVAVLDAAGTALAGPPGFAAAAADLLTVWSAPADVSGPPVDELVARTDGGVVFAARSSAHAVVAAAGPLSLVGPTALDVRAALAALTGTPTPADGTPPALADVADPALRRAISALTTAH